MNPEEIRKLDDEKIIKGFWKNLACSVDGSAVSTLESDEFREELLRRLSQRRGLVEALRMLSDAQNGPPLVRYEAQWNEAMDKAAQILKECEP